MLILIIQKRLLPETKREISWIHFKKAGSRWQLNFLSQNLYR
jgi:hypothetical protein